MNNKTFMKSMELYHEAQSRRLFKARHQEMDKMEIRTKAHGVILTHDMSRFTVYKLQIRSKVRRGDTGKWILAKRYSEFDIFRRNMLRMIQQWETQVEESKKAQSKEFSLISNSLRRPIMPNFPRKHMRCDTEAIINERRQGLAEFVRKLLDAYADISVFMYNTQSNDTEGYAQIRQIFLLLEEFLDIPQAQKEVERRQTAAVLALEDVDVVKPSDSDCKDRTCCICLDDIDSDDEDNTEEGDENEHERVESDKMVKLPCSHQFHEDCVIDWFNASTTCPLCRQPAFTEEALSFDVSLH